jgi:hypothetical protein
MQGSLRIYQRLTGINSFGIIAAEISLENFMLTTNPATKNNDRVAVPYPAQDTTPPEVQKVPGSFEKTAENLAYYICGNPWKTAGLLLAAVALGIFCERRRRN